MTRQQSEAEYWQQMAEQAVRDEQAELRRKQGQHILDAIANRSNDGIIETLRAVHEAKWAPKDGDSDA